MVASLGSPTTNNTVSNTPTANTGPVGIPTTTAPVPPGGIPQTPFDAVRQTVGSGVGEAANAAIQFMHQANLGLALANRAGNADTGGLFLVTQVEIAKLQTTNKTLQQEISELTKGLENTQPDATPDGNNELLNNLAKALATQQTALNTLNNDLNANPPVPPETLEADRQALAEADAGVETAKAAIEEKIAGIKEQLKTNNTKIAQLQNQLLALSSLVPARDELADAIKLFDNSPANLFSQTSHENAKDAAKHTRQLEQQVAAVQGQVLATEQDRRNRLQAAVDRAGKIKAALGKALDNGGAISAEELLRYHRETGEALPGVLEQEDEEYSGYSAEDAQLAASLVQAGSASQNNQNKTVLDAILKSSANGTDAVEGNNRAAAQISSGDNRFDDGINPFDDGENPLGPDVDHFAIDESNPVPQGIAVLSDAALVDHGQELLAALNDALIRSGASGSGGAGGKLPLELASRRDGRVRLGLG